MRVLVVHGRYRSVAPSGENAVVDQEIVALRAAGHDVSRFESHSDDIASAPIHRRALIPLTSIWNPTTKRELVAQLAQRPVDVVHVHNTFPLLSHSVLEACAESGVPVVATIHNYKLLCASGDFFRGGRPCHDCAGGSLAPALKHGCYRGSRVATIPVVAGCLHGRSRWRDLVSAFIFISEAQRDMFGALRLPHERTFVKPNFVPGPAARSRARDHTVAYVGRLDEAKGVPLLLAGWDAFRARAPQARLRLVIAGGGPLESAVREWSSTRDDVVFRGLMTRDEAAEVIANSLAVVVPSAWEETFGLVAIEAMAAGVAPVAPAHGAFPGNIRDGVDGVLFPPGDAGALGQVLLDIDRYPERYRDIGAAGIAPWADRFREEPNIDDLVKIYNFAVENTVVAP